MDERPRQEFCWIELAARTDDGGMCRNQFVRVDDKDAIAAWRKRFNNCDVFTSICRFSEPNRDAAYVCDAFLDIDAQDLEMARWCVLTVCNLMIDKWQLSTGSLDISFSGAKGFHVCVALEVFDGFSSPYLMKLWRGLASRLGEKGTAEIDSQVYQIARLWRLPNSINSKTGLYKIPLEYEELSDLGIEYVLEIASEPRNEASMAVPEPSVKAAQWFRDAIAHVERQAKRCSGRPAQLHHGWRVPPCIRRLEQTTLMDGMRHQAYLQLARFYARVGMHPEEAAERIQRLDSRHPISNPEDIDRIVRYGQAHPGFPGCNDLTRAFCSENECFYARLRKGGYPNET